MFVFAKCDNDKWMGSIKQTTIIQPIGEDQEFAFPDAIDVVSKHYPIVGLGDIDANMSKVNVDGTLNRNDIKLLRGDVMSAIIRRTKAGDGFFGQYSLMDDSASNADLKEDGGYYAMMEDPLQVCYAEGSDIAIGCVISKSVYDGEMRVNLNGKFVVPIWTIERPIEESYLNFLADESTPNKPVGTLFDTNTPVDSVSLGAIPDTVIQNIDNLKF